VQVDVIVTRWLAQEVFLATLSKAIPTFSLENQATETGRIKRM
jgi:hypothetical protein